ASARRCALDVKWSLHTRRRRNCWQTEGWDFVARTPPLGRLQVRGSATKRGSWRRDSLSLPLLVPHLADKGACVDLCHRQPFAPFPQPLEICLGHASRLPLDGSELDD